MTYPSIRSEATTTGSVTGTNMNCNLPGTIVAGDLLLLFIVNRAAISTAQTFTAPFDWTEVPSFAWQGPGTNTRMKFDAFYKIADGTESGSVSISTSYGSTVRFCSYMVALSSVQGTPTISTAAGVNATSGNWDAPSVTFANSGKDMLVFAIDTQESTVNAFGYPSGYGLAQHDIEFASSSTGTRLGVAAKQVTGASSENPPSGTSSSVAWNAGTLAVEGLSSAVKRGKAIIIG